MSSAGEKDSSNTSQSTAPERRHNLRFPFTASIEAIESKSGARVTGRTSDLSLGGCYVDALSPFPVGTLATIKITRENESFEAQAKIVYSQIGMGMGIAFVSAQPKQVRLFQRWLLEISGKELPLPEPSAEQPEPVVSAPGEKKNYVLSELLITLMRKGVLTETEGKELLKKLLL
jgi:hypothetical protein